MPSVGCPRAGRVCTFERDQVEAEAIAGLTELLDWCAEPGDFAREVNDALRRLWKEQAGQGAEAAAKVKAVDERIAHIRFAIEGGLADTGWPNERLRALKEEREGIAGSLQVPGEAPQIDLQAAAAYRHDVARILRTDTPLAQKRLLRHCIEEMKVAPER